MPEPSQQHITSLTGGVSDATVLYVSLAGFVLLGLSMYWFIFAKLDPDAHDEDDVNNRDYDQDLDEADVGTLNRAQRRARAKNRMKKKRRIEPARRPPGAAPEEGEDEAAGDNANPAIMDADGAGEDSEEEVGGTRPVQSLSRKERQRLAKAAEKEERRQYVLEREAALKRNEQEESYHERRQREKAEENRVEEERQMIAKEKKEKEQKEHCEWRTMFRIEGSGEVILVKDFVAYLKRRKVVDIEDISDQYSLPTNFVIQRLKDLVEEGRINGVFNDRGQFIYLSSEEVDSVSRSVRERGRVTLEELGCECSNFPKTQSNSE